MKLSALLLVLLAGNALAWENPYEYRPRMPRTTNSYDPSTGNMTNPYRHADGSSDTYGINPRTGSQWNSNPVFYSGTSKYYYAVAATDSNMNESTLTWSSGSASFAASGFEVFETLLKPFVPCMHLTCH